MKKILVAVSGGVDSVVLLDFLAKNVPCENLIVAHFEHGIRGQESLRDLEFVRNLAEKYGVKFEFAHGNLGENASEEQARTARYDFLRNLAEKFDADIFTAHHGDDLIETILINFRRGTGWRGLACLNSKGVVRPFLRFRKAEILEYARRKNLDWCEDSTNLSEKYLRNRIRRENLARDFEFDKILYLWQKQVEISQKIDGEVSKILDEISQIQSGKVKFSRYFFSQIDEKSASEILRKIIIENCQKTPTRQQILDFWLKIKTLPSGKTAQIVGGAKVKFSKRDFWFNID